MHCYAVSRRLCCRQPAARAFPTVVGAHTTRVTRCASLFAPLREESSFLNDCDRSRLLMLFPRVIPQMCSHSSSPQLKPLWQKAFAGSFGHSGAILDASRAFHLRAVSSLAFPPVGPFWPNYGPQFAVQFKSVNNKHDEAVKRSHW